MTDTLHRHGAYMLQMHICISHGVLWHGSQGTAPTPHVYSTGLCSHLLIALVYAVSCHSFTQS